MQLTHQIRNPRFLLAFPPQQFAANEIIRPDGTLALPYLDGALTSAGFESRIVDMSVGTARDGLADTFHRQTPLERGMVRIGMTPERIVEEVRDADVVALTSIFTQQTSRCFEVSRLVKEAYPDKILLAGGVNARSLKEHFFEHGFDLVCTSEGEQPIVELARALHAGTDLREVPGLAMRVDGRTLLTRPPRLTTDLDTYAMPAWDKLPNDRYWEIGRIWGGREGWMEDVARPRYASILTSRGCPFRCIYCHISQERGGEAGDIASLRLHSVRRVEQELDRLRGLGITHLYITDDSFLAKKPRVSRILRQMRNYRFVLADVNGVNIIHLYTRQGGKLVVDEALLEELAAAGFRKLSLPFESGSQRVLDTYSTAKWRIADCDLEALVRKLGACGITADANFMIGYPDETLDELTSTFMLARRMMDAGLVACQFFMVQPFPGTRLFEQSIANGQLAPDWHWDDLGWCKGSPFTHPTINKDTLKYCWSLVWKLLNRETRVREVNSQMLSVSLSPSERLSA